MTYGRPPGATSTGPRAKAPVDSGYMVALLRQHQRDIENLQRNRTPRPLNLHQAQDAGPLSQAKHGQVPFYTHTKGQWIPKTAPGSYASLSGPGETTPTGALIQAGFFHVEGGMHVDGFFNVTGGTMDLTITATVHIRGGNQLVLSSGHGTTTPGHIHIRAGTGGHIAFNGVTPGAAYPTLTGSATGTPGLVLYNLCLILGAYGLIKNTVTP